MQEPIDLFDEPTRLLEGIGGEPLTGSGFETEEPEPEFEAGELVHLERYAPGEE